MIDQSTIEEVEKYVRDSLNEKLPDFIHYHNIDHVRFVVKNAKTLGAQSNLSESDMAILEVAAWFHDIGFVRDPNNHEEEGAQIADDFLSERNISKTDIQIVKELILSTKMGTDPKTLMEKLLNDADVSHLGSKSYFKRSARLRDEWELIQGKELSDEEWWQMNADFMEKQEFHTDAAKELFSEQKEANLERLKKKESANPGKKKKKKKESSPLRIDRGVETMFRVTLKNHIQLSQIADNKANIMLSINAIIISIVLTSLLPKLDKNTFLIWPSVLLLAVCIATVVLATISTIPKVTKGRIDKLGIEEKRANLLFFGNFHGMSLEDFNWGMNKMIRDEEYLYGSMIKDLYFLGKVLYKKYKYLRLCYAVFMVGIIASVVFYLISMAIAFSG